MIGFCEDCGAKNTLAQDAVRNGIVRFTCLTCGYANAYAFPGNPEVPEKLSQVIAACPDILAAFLFKKGDRPVIIRLPKGLTPSDMAPLGAHLTMSFLSARTIYPGIRKQTVRIADKHITVAAAGQDGFLFLVGKTDVLPETVQSLLSTLAPGAE